MKKRKLILYLSILLLALQLPTPLFPIASEVQANSVGRDYYISSINGDNQNDATTEKEAWETLNKLKEITLQPGDRVLLESGSVFNGVIHLKDVHGTAENPIIISDYGDGEKPIINGNGEGVWYQDYMKGLDNPGHKKEGYVSSTILLYDASFIEIGNLEITNQSDDWDYMLSDEEQVKSRMDRTGVAGIAQNNGTMEHIYLDNLYIHDIDGNLEDKHMNNGGIQFNVSKPENEEETGIARYHDIKITNNHIKDARRAGISLGYTYQYDKFFGAKISDETAQKYGHTEILMEGNYVQDIGNDGIVVMYAYRPIVKSNISDRSGVDLAEGYPGYWMSYSAAIWPWKSKDALFEYNEAFDTVGEGNGDGQAWNIDWSDGTTYQYNYSHNNGGGALLICLSEAVNGTFRYNISQNDLKSFVTFQGNPLAEVYNNVFYVDGDRSTRVHHPAPQKQSGVGYLANNIFYNTSTNNPNDEWNPGNNKTFSNNLYFGYSETPANDEKALTKDPLFIKPGTAPEQSTGMVHGLDAFSGYKVAENSPVINAGTYISNNTTMDFFKNPIGLIPDIGVHELDGDEAGVHEVYSDVYTILDERMIDVPSDTTVSELLKNIKRTTSTTLEVKNGDTVLTDDDIIKNGYVLTATFADASVKEYVLELKKNYSEYSTDGIVARAGSEQPGQVASNALDGDMETMWHTAWSGANQDELWISIDLQDVKPIAMLKYIPRQTGGTNGIFTKYSIYVKKNEADKWKEIATYDDTWKQDLETKYAYFDTIDARYIKLQAAESATQEFPKLFGSAAEIRVGYEEAFEEEK